MPVKPTLNSMLICDTAIMDAETRKRSLIGIFQNIRSVNFPCMHQLLYVYASLTDARGEYVFGLRLVDGASDKELWNASLPPLQIADPLHVHEICVRIMRLTFPTPGRYEFQLHANGELLDLRRINLEKVEPGQLGMGAPPPGQPPQEPPGQPPL
jgi:hypothetical protein